MKIKIKNDLKSEELSKHIRLQISKTLGRFRDYVKSLSIRIFDLNGPKGGADKKCLVCVTKTGSKQLVFEATSANSQIAVDQAIHGIIDVIQKEISRQRNKQRKNGSIFQII